MQTKRASVLEAVANQIIGTLLIYISQVIYFNLAGVNISSPKHLGLLITGIVISMSKHYVIRRYFERKKHEQKRNGK